MIQNGHAAAMATVETALTFYTRSVEIGCSAEKAFAFCSTRAGFEAHFPHAVDRYQGSETWHAGDEFSFRYRYLGLWFSWAGQITAYEENAMFRDQMSVSLFKSFIHTHRFDRISDTRMRYTDSIQFSLGFGGLVDRLIGKRLVDATFAKRHELLKRALEV